MSARRPLFIANWKMNKLQAEVSAFVDRFLPVLPPGCGEKYEVGIAPVAIHLPRLVECLQGTSVYATAQNCGTQRFGAFTGEVSPTMLKDLGVSWVLIGHSERRHVFKEDDTLLQLRVKAARAEGLTAVFCVGETLEERKSGRTFTVIDRQLGALAEFGGKEGIEIAYEPVWAIGTGENATPAQAAEVHHFIRGRVGPTPRILYGGSVKPENAAELRAQPDVEGLLVGGASLDPLAFAEIIKKGLG